MLALFRFVSCPTYLLVSRGWLAYPSPEAPGIAYNAQIFEGIVADWYGQQPFSMVAHSFQPRT